MEWTLKTREGSPARAAVEKPYALGMITIPARPPMPARDAYTATIGDSHWGGVQSKLVEFWEKACELWPQYYNLTETAASWDRVLCTIDGATGSIRAQARLGNETPPVPRIVLVTVTIPFLARALEKLGDPKPDSNGEDPRYDAAYDAMIAKITQTLATAAETEPARSKLAAMRKQHPFALMVEQEDWPESLRPLTLRG